MGHRDRGETFIHSNNMTWGHDEVVWLVCGVWCTYVVSLGPSDVLVPNVNRVLRLVLLLTSETAPSETDKR